MLKLALVRVTELETEILATADLSAELAKELATVEGRVFRKGQFGPLLVQAVNTALDRVEGRLKHSSVTL